MANLYLALAAVLSIVAAFLFVWAAYLLHPRFRRGTHTSDRRETYRASDTTIPATRR